jgi:DNA polymerase III alpha subunit (gram-positive type)
MEILIGKPIRQRPEPLSHIDQQSGKVTVWGDIFSIDSRETRDGESVILSIMITDYTGSNILKIIKKKEEAAPLFDLKKGMTIMARATPPTINTNMTSQSGPTIFPQSNASAARTTSRRSASSCTCIPT